MGLISLPLNLRDHWGRLSIVLRAADESCDNASSVKTY